MSEYVSEEMSEEMSEEPPEAGVHLGNIACAGYEAYATSTGGKNFQGEPMPAWWELPGAIRLAWMYATDEICRLYALAVSSSPSEYSPPDIVHPKYADYREAQARGGHLPPEVMP